MSQAEKNDTNVILVRYTREYSINQLLDLTENKRSKQDDSSVFFNERGLENHIDGIKLPLDGDQQQIFAKPKQSSNHLALYPSLVTTLSNTFCHVEEVVAIGPAVE